MGIKPKKVSKEKLFNVVQIRYMFLKIENSSGIIKKECIYTYFHTYVYTFMCVYLYSEYITALLKCDSYPTLCYILLFLKIYLLI